MITDGKLDTIGPSGHLEAMSTAVAALPPTATGCSSHWRPAGAAVGAGATPAARWHPMRARTT
jgi:hypothetical protein